MRSLLGTNISDLQKARSGGKTKIVALSRDKAFDKVLRVLDEKSLTVFMSDREKGYIVAIGLPKQTSTTRVGIFFETADKDHTKITLSSLSSSALAKAEFMIFGSI
ncbi:MAG: hypothetical protein GF392_01770 [Candidatus Omnitrophica bacterium]|nr:hypothetical protein [Candidatus Omnitrophota bacterium]